MERRYGGRFQRFETPDWRGLTAALGGGVANVTIGVLLAIIYLIKDKDPSLPLAFTALGLVYLAVVVVVRTRRLRRKRPLAD